MHDVFILLTTCLFAPSSSLTSFLVWIALLFFLLLSPIPLTWLLLILFGFFSPFNPFFRLFWFLLSTTIPLAPDLAPLNPNNRLRRMG